jgi:hypothetical protein
LIYMDLRFLYGYQSECKFRCQEVNTYSADISGIGNAIFNHHMYKRLVEGDIQRRTNAALAISIKNSDVENAVDSIKSNFEARRFDEKALEKGKMAINPATGRPLCPVSDHLVAQS